MSSLSERGQYSAFRICGKVIQSDLHKVKTVVTTQYRKGSKGGGYRIAFVL